MAEYAGQTQGEGLKIAIVVARFNSFVTERLLRGAQRTLGAHGVAPNNVATAHVPGSFEIPLVAKRLAHSGSYDAIICLGAVIRGETSHYDYVCEAVSLGVLQAGMDTGVPVIFGVLTTDTAEQARSRAGEGPGNKGSEAALAAIEMANLLRSIGPE